MLFEHVCAHISAHFKYVKVQLHPGHNHFLQPWIKRILNLWLALLRVSPALSSHEIRNHSRQRALNSIRQGFNFFPEGDQCLALPCCA